MCKICLIRTYLQVKIVAKSTLGNTLAADIPVLIGTIPIMSTNNIPNGGMPMPNTVPQMPQPPQNPNILARNTQQQDFLVPPQPSAPGKCESVMPRWSTVFVLQYYTVLCM